MMAKDLIIAMIVTSLQLQSFVQGAEDHRGLNAEHTRISTKRVLFGEPANPYEFPFFVSIHFDDLFCGGTIIGNEWVMTAAHCVYGMSCYNGRIIPATWENSNGINPILCVIHPRYVRGWFAFDISLLKVSPGYLNDGLTKSINLPQPGLYFPPGTPGVIVGFGQTESAFYPRMLLRADIQVEAWDKCNLEFKNNDYQCISTPQCTGNDMPNRVLCTIGLGFGPPGTCFGDSGGPVIVNGCVAGIVSFVMKQGDYCKVGAPSMHVNVVDYLPWLLSVVAPEMDTSAMKVCPEY